MKEYKQYFANGPEGTFITLSLKFAEDIIKAMNFDRDEWTITDVSDLEIIGLDN